MDKAHKLDEMFSELQAVIRTCDKTTYKEHWNLVEEYVMRASYIVYNFHLSVDELQKDLDGQVACKNSMEKICENIETDEDIRKAHEELFKLMQGKS